MLSTKVLKAMLELHESIKKMEAVANQAWAITPHYCPLCKRSITDPKSWEYSVEIGHCLNCDHVMENIT